MDLSEFKGSLIAQGVPGEPLPSICIVIRSIQQIIDRLPNQPPSSHLGANLKNLRASFRSITSSDEPTVKRG